MLHAGRGRCRWLILPGGRGRWLTFTPGGRGRPMHVLLLLLFHWPGINYLPRFILARTQRFSSHQAVRQCLNILTVGRKRLICNCGLLSCSCELPICSCENALPLRSVPVLIPERRCQGTNTSIQKCIYTEYSGRPLSGGPTTSNPRSHATATHAMLQLQNTKRKTANSHAARHYHHHHHHDHDHDHDHHHHKILATTALLPPPPPSPPSPAPPEPVENHQVLQRQHHHHHHQHHHQHHQHRHHHHHHHHHHIHFIAMP